MGPPSITVLITDLDNTLYDWVTYFSCAFYDMVAAASPLLGVEQEELLDDLRDVNQRLHNSEHPYALLEAKAVRMHLGHLSRAEQAKALDKAFHAFNSTRVKILKLYEGVEETLARVHEQGALIVGHTEATVPNAVFRLRKLGIERFFSTLYASTPQGLEPPTIVDNVLSTTPIKVSYLPPEERKPNPAVLVDICRQLKISVTSTLYIGDSISRDIGMAKEAGLWAAWAEYGTNYDRFHWDRLVRITHWTAEDVQRAKAAAQHYGHAKPDVILHKNLSEIFSHFVFSPYQ